MQLEYLGEEDEPATSLRQRLRERNKPKLYRLTSTKSGLEFIANLDKDNKIVNIESVIALPDKSTFDLYEIIPYISSESVLNQDFYSAIQHIPNKLNKDFKHIFFDNLKQTTGKVRIISVGGHTGLLKKNILSIPKLHKIAVVPNGICSFSSVKENIDVLNELTPIADDKKFIDTSKDACLAYLLYTFQEPTLPSNIETKYKAEYDEAYELCSKITTTQEEITTQGNEYQNIYFESFPKLSFLYVGFIPSHMNTYVYKNMFSIVDNISIKTLLETYIPNCSEVTLVHHGCTPFLLGGKRKQTRKKHKKIKRCKITNKSTL